MIELVDKDTKVNIYDDLKRGSTNELCSFILQNPHKKFYKYRAGEQRDVIALNENKFWMGCAAYMDDPVDCGFTVNENWDAAYKIMCQKEEKFKAEKYAKVIKEKGSVFQKDLYICSMSETATNEDLWERYADSHRGFCIEYDLDDFNSIGRIVLPVVYGNVCKSIFDFSRYEKAANIFEIILKKEASEWSQQDEWRIISWAKDLGITSGEKGKLIDSPIPTAIYCGKHISVDLKKQLREFTQNNNISRECEINSVN